MNSNFEAIEKKKEKFVHYITKQQLNFGKYLAAK